MNFLKILIGGVCRELKMMNFSLCLMRFGEEMRKLRGLEDLRRRGAIREREGLEVL